MFDELVLNHSRVGNDLCAAVFINEGALFLSERISDATGAGHRPSAKKKGQTQPVIFGAIALDQIDPIASAKKPDAKRNQRIDPMLQRHRDDWSSELSRLGHYFACRIANQPGPVTVGVKPIDFETGAIFLSAPTAAALEMK